ncbi:choice-of-anchor Q domain-containing protein [Elongatibacter sediminis]|uniref:Choice-of-anchor Q domain-containing protein n=1 Tax=Elongatibacter sediminis TaxID=3119006 RepID=A0AAW9RKL2_9GAMM
MRFRAVAILFLAVLGLGANELAAATIDIGPNGCSLADAIRSANNDSASGNCSAGSGTDTIVAPNGWVIPLSSTLPTINSNLTIQSESSGGVLTVSGDFAHKIMRINGASTNVVLRRVALVDGRVGSATGTGGAALDISEATVSIFDSEISGNKVTDNTGSAIHITNGELNITSSEVFGNSMRITGVFSPERTAIYARNSEVNVTDSEFFANVGAEPDLVSASIYMDGGELNFVNSLVNEFRYGLRGEQAIVNIVNSTFDKTDGPNYPDHDLIYFTDNSFVSLVHVTDRERTVLEDSSFSAVNSILTHCEFTNVVVTFDAGNYNRYSNCLGRADGEGNLLPLAENGGPTRTSAISYPSNMIDFADQAYCEPVDQRGEPRVGDCDVGAFEVTGTANVAISQSLLPNAPYVNEQPVTLNLQVSNNGPNLASDLRVDLDLDNVFIEQINSTDCPSLPCDLASLQYGQVVSIPIDLNMGNAFNGPYSIDASVTSTAQSTHHDPDESDPDGNNFASIEGTLQNGADLSVTLDLLSNPPFVNGQLIEYKATVTNNGPDSADGIELLFSPDGLSVLGFDNCPSSTGNTCYLNPLNDGAQYIFTIDTKLTSTQFNAEAQVSSNLVDPNLANNTDNQNNGGAVAETDLFVTVRTLTQPPYFSNQYLQFEIKLASLSGTASSIQLDTDLPGGYYIGVQGCTNSPCILPYTLAEEESVTILADWFAPVRDPDGPSDWTYTVTATPGQTDTQPANNTAQTSEPLAYAADVWATLDLVSSPPFMEGEEIEYRLRVVNSGLNHAGSVLIATQPENLTLEFANGQRCASIPCEIPQLDRFNDEIITLVYRIDAAGPFDLSATVYADEFDPDESNNIDETGNDGIAEAVPVADVIFAAGFE